MNKEAYDNLSPREKLWVDLGVEVLGEMSALRREMVRLANALEAEVKGLTQ